MRLVTVRAEIAEIKQGISLPLQDPERDQERVHPPLQQYLLLGERGMPGMFRQVPVHADLCPGPHEINLLKEGELVKQKIRRTNAPESEAHGYELVPASQSHDARMLALIDTRGSRHQPNTTAGWKIVEGRGENVVVGTCIRGKSGRGGTCYIGLVLIWPGCEIMVRPEGKAPFLLVYADVETGLVCDMGAVENRNKIKAAVRHERRDSCRALWLQEKISKQELYRRKNAERRRQLEKARTRLEAMERERRQAHLRRALKFVCQLREVKDPALRKQLLEKRLAYLQRVRACKAKGQRNVRDAEKLRASLPKLQAGDDDVG